MTEFGEYYQTLNVLDCMVIATRTQDMKYDPQTNPTVQLPGHQVDISTMQVIVKGSPGQKFIL